MNFLILDSGCYQGTSGRMKVYLDYNRKYLEITEPARYVGEVSVEYISYDHEGRPESIGIRSTAVINAKDGLL